MADKEKADATTGATGSDDKIVEFFNCVLCNMQEQIEYKGFKPPFAKQIVLSEANYVIRDPFSPPTKNQVLILGADCSLCNQPVCKDTKCSIFYGKTFCKTCADANILLFPNKIQTLIKKSFAITPKKL